MSCGIIYVNEGRIYMERQANDCVVSVRCKSTTLATLVKYRELEGTLLGMTQSSLVKDAIEALAHLIVNKQPETEFTSVTHARQYLELHGFKLNAGREEKGKETAFKLLRNEAIAGTDKQLGSDEYSTEYIEHAAKAHITQTKEREERARRMLQEQKSREQTLTEQRDRRQEELARREMEQTKNATK